MRHDRSVPLADQLAVAATISQDDTTRYLFTVVRSNLDDQTEAFFCDPTSDRLSALVGLWTRAVKLLKDTRDPTAPTVENQAKTM